MWSSPSWVSQVLGLVPHPDSLAGFPLLPHQLQDVENTWVVSFHKFNKGSSSLEVKNSMFVE